jgi:hypothetical protein
LTSTQETYAVQDENGKEYTIFFSYEENVGWENKQVFDIETDKDITDTELGKEILEAFKNKKGGRNDNRRKEKIISKKS